MIWIPTNQTVSWHHPPKQPTQLHLRFHSIKTINNQQGNPQQGDLRGARRAETHCTVVFGKMWRHKNVQKNSVFFGGVVEAFFVGEILFCFFWVLFFLLRGFGMKRVSVLFYRVFFLLKGGNSKNACFKKDLHLDAMCIFFELWIKSKQQQKTMFEMSRCFVGAETLRLLNAQGSKGKIFQQFLGRVSETVFVSWMKIPKWFSHEKKWWKSPFPSIYTPKP